MLLCSQCQLCVRRLTVSEEAANERTFQTLDVDLPTLQTCIKAAHVRLVPAVLQCQSAIE